MYYTIAKAIEYVHQHLAEQPSLQDIADAVGTSPSHLQRSFTQWTGLSPKRLMQFLTLDFIKKQVRSNDFPLFTAIDEVGLKAPARAYELFIRVEGMSPDAYRNGGAGLDISYHLYDSIYGRVFIAHTEKGLCRLSFVEGNEDLRIETLQSEFPQANWKRMKHPQDQHILQVLENPLKRLEPIHLHLKGTPFQLKVWEALLNLSPEQWTSYGKIAQQLNNPNASRAVGSAVGANPVAIIIPCHRVLRANGALGGYYWGPVKKHAILMREYGLVQSSKSNML